MTLMAAATLMLVGEDRVCYEVDYPHSDAPWPDAPEVLWRSVSQLSDGLIDKVTHLNAMKLYRFDPCSASITPRNS